MNKVTIEDISKSVDHLARQLKHGCGNHGCIIYNPIGMGTTSTCQCQPARIADKLLRMAEQIEAMGNEWRRK